MDPITPILPSAAIIAEIDRLKREHNAILLAHTYQTGDIQDIADVVGDSLTLAQAAARTNADVIVFCGVHFMAERPRSSAPPKPSCCRILTQVARWQPQSMPSSSERGKPNIPTQSSFLMSIRPQKSKPKATTAAPPATPSASFGRSPQIGKSCFCPICISARTSARRLGGPSKSGPASAMCMPRSNPNL